MIRILAVSGSPVDGASTDILLDYLAGCVAKGLEINGLESGVRFVKLNELKCLPCQACGEDPHPRLCFFDDGLEDVLPEVVDCDCLLVGTPVYFDSVSAQLKAFIDRSNCFRPPDYKDIDPDHHFVRRITRTRTGAMVLVGGERGWFEGARRVIAGYFKWVEVVSEGMVVHHSTDFKSRGSARGNSEAQEGCEEVAGRIVRQLTGV